jgi:uncharacterized protein YqjF (DUF2071 family)
MQQNPPIGAAMPGRIYRILGASPRRLAAGECVPLLLADWVDALFIHYAVEPGRLGPHVPFELDQKDGRALVSFVAFTQRRFRPIRGGRTGEMLLRPIAAIPFLNLRTYVTHKGQPGIYFISEWISSPIAVALGPAVYGLPYRLGSHDYRCDRQAGVVDVRVDAPEGRFQARGTFRPDALTRPQQGTATHFLLERYIAFTQHRSVCRQFQIAHAPWPHVSARPNSLIRAS